MHMAEEQLEDKNIKSVGNPLIFISHDTRDAELAEAFSNLLKSVSAGVLKSFRTSLNGIPKSSKIFKMQRM
jgi:hypothetical protein